MAYPPELERLLPPARAVLRYLSAQPDCGAPLPDIIAGAGLSERAAGKAIRQLVTRYYLNMPTPGFYNLTQAGRDAARDLRVGEAEALSEAETAPAEISPASAPMETAPVATMSAGGDTPRAADLRQRRTLTLAAPGELVAGMTVAMQVGLAAAEPDQPPLRQPARLIVRLSAEDCRVQPRERPLEVGASAAGPLRFRVTPQGTGAHRLKFEVFQLVAPEDLRRVGGMLCDLHAAKFPTLHAAEVATLGAAVTLFVG